MTKCISSTKYTYGNNASPYALTAVNGNVYTFDDNGNNLTGGGRTLVYSTYDLPTSINRNGHTATFAYGVDRSRYRRVDSGPGGTTTTRYIGNVEIIDRPNGTVEKKRYIAGIAIETGYYTGGSETSRDTVYTLKDHLGSLDVIVDDTGAIDQKLSFGPWGQRRDATNWEEVDAGALLIDLGPTFDISNTTRGFTGHEMIDQLGIVHMNGRIYDPFLGRFLQADNYVQAPYNTQSHNRFTYVWNNPLNATDPSGEFVFSIFAMAIIAGEGIAKAWAIAAIMAGTATLDALIAGADLSDAFLSGIISGLSAGAFAKVGSVLIDKLGGSFAGGLSKLGFTVKVISHGVIRGLTNVIRGGKFGHGFASSAVSAGVSAFNNYQYIGSRGISAVRMVIAAAVGGTASKLSGGKFANGAAYAAFGEAVNSAATQNQDIGYDSPMADGQTFEEYFLESSGQELNDVLAEINRKVGDAVTPEFLERLHTDPEFTYRQFRTNPELMDTVVRALTTDGPTNLSNLPVDGPSGYRRMSFWRNFFHDPFKNTKYIGPNGHQERVYTQSGTLVTSVTHRGSYNFFDPIRFPGNHWLADVRRP